MPLRIQTALLFLIAAPLGMLGWIGVALMRSEELSARRQVVSLAEGRLLELVRAIDDAMSNQHRQVKQQMEQEGKLPERLMILERKEPHLRRSLWVSARGQLLYPPAPSSNADNEYLIYNELTMLARQRPPVPMAIRRKLVANPADATADPRLTTEITASESMVSGQEPSEVGDQLVTKEARWREWYFDEGLQLVVWSVRPDGSAIGCWLERARWMADLIAILPDVEPSSNDSATALIDTNGNVVYRWGSMDELPETPLAEIALKEPLASWRFRYYIPLNPTNTSSWLRYRPLALAVSAGAFALMGLGAYVSFATSRQLRLAKQRVSFAGQVSHELRTPLTNIRLYAEMAKRDLTHAEPALQRVAERLEVIDSESKRLSRLISGVLEFMQGRNKSQPLELQSVVPDETVEQVLTQCALSLNRSGIVVTTDLNANRRVAIDSDVLEQILINLISNVEKYAAAGKSLNLVTKMDNDFLTVDVCDSGVGIAKRFGNRIFKPFFRLDDSITAPSGTGLGLTIALAAAKRHGGGLELIPSKSGAHFRLRLRIWNDATGQVGVNA